MPSVARSRLSGATRHPDRLRSILAGLALAFVLVLPPSASIPAAAALQIEPEDITDVSGQTAVVAHSGDGVNMRAEPGLGAEVVDTLPDGTVVELRIDVVDTVVDEDARWWPVRHAGQDGWIAGFYLESSDAAPTDDGDTSSDESDGESGSGDEAAGETPEFAQGDYVAVDSDDGLAMRAGPSVDEDHLAALGDGDVVQVMDGPFWDDEGNGWYLVTDGDFSAYVFGAFLAAAGDLDVEADSVELEDALFAPGDIVAPAPGSGGVNVRSRASVNSRRLGALAEGEAIEIVASAEWDKQGDVWYQVQYGDAVGYMFGALLVSADSVELAVVTGPTGTFIYPLSSYVFTQAYGCSGLWLEPYDANLGCPFHNGIDLAAPAYTTIMAADGGTVVASGWCDCGLGFFVEIDHGNGFATVYGHMAEQPWVAVGQEVNQGDAIGPVGSTGISTGPHVHFMLKVNGSTVDPLGYL